MIDFVKVGTRISEHRKRLGLSQGELADMLYVTRQALSKWENGLSVPSIDALSQLSRLFGVSFEEILGLFESEETLLDSEDIFRGHDRAYIVTKIAAGEIKVDLPEVFYQFSPAERMYLLKCIKLGRLNVNLGDLWVRLSPSEQKYMGENLPTERS